ncbi:F0F1 ATP synthase subunit B [Candidatus Curtissbacteria bacterium]|nr:F0F1 ATP synthase subunit B [Candidatus Curtissbacteria bacterium]
MEILTRFGIQPTLLLAQIVNFLVILFLLRKFFFGPIVKVLDDRKKRIEESLKNADLIEEKLAKAEQNSQKILEEARTNAANIATDAKREADRIYEQTATDARKLTEETIAKATIQIEKQRQELEKQLEKETLTLVALIVKKVLGRNLRDNERQNLTQKAIAQITKQIH